MREIRKLESEGMRSNPAVWGFTIPTPPRRGSIDVTAKTEALECEVVELRNLISLAESKADEMLKIGANDEISQPQAVNVPAESMGLEQLGELSAGKSCSYATACFREPESYSKDKWREAEVMNLQFRRADPSDAEEAITLIYSSGPHELDYAFAVGHHRVLDLLRIAFVDGSSTLGYGSQVVAVLDGHVVGIGAFHDGANYGRANRKVLYPVARFYGPLTGAGVLTRLTQLEKQLWPPPKKHDVFVQHLGVREDLRGNGIGTALLTHQIEMARARHFRRFILDVAVTNPRAQVLCERLGFRVVEEREWHITSSTAHVPDARRMEMVL
jgi:ribosomal protein S18 acetylase RimI-like enzyme